MGNVVKVLGRAVALEAVDRIIQVRCIAVAASTLEKPHLLS